MTREELAEIVTSGLAGWLQLRDAEGVANLHGEEAARLALVQILRAQAKWRTKVPFQPDTWAGTGKRLDLALLPWDEEAASIYGLLELKWPGNVDVTQTRRDLVQDAVRVVSVAMVGDMRPAFVVLGCRGELETGLFDTVHPRAPETEAARVAFGSLFKRDLANPDGAMSRADLDLHFPDFAARVPAGPVVNHELQAKLVAMQSATRGATPLGRVLVWHCSQRAGRPGA